MIRPVQQSHICVGTAGLSMTDPRRYAFLILNQILGAGMSSRLFQQLRESQGLVYNIYSFIESWYDTGIFGVYAAASRSNINRVVESIEAELDTMARRPLKNDELERIKKQIEGHMILAHEDVNFQMDRLARFAVYNRPYMSLIESIDQVKRVTSSDIQDVARQLFQEQPMCYSLLVPES